MADPGATSAPTHALLVCCIECGDGVEVLLPTDIAAITLLIARRGWHISVLTPPGQDPIVGGVLCATCAPRIFPPEVLKAAEERRQKLLEVER